MKGDDLGVREPAAGVPSCLWQEIVGCRDLVCLAGVFEVAARGLHDEQHRPVLPFEDLDGLHGSPLRAAHRPRRPPPLLVPRVTSGKRDTTRVNYLDGRGELWSPS